MFPSQMEMSRDDTFDLQQKKTNRRSIQALEAMLDVGSPAVRDQQISKALKRRSTTLNVQKSIELLNESVGSPSTRSLRTPGGSMRKNMYTPQLLSSGTKFDVSARMGPTPKKTPQAQRSLHRAFGDEGTLTPQRTPSAMAPLPEEDYTQEITTTNIGLLLEDDPGVAASRSLYKDFLTCMRTHSSQGDLFTLVEQYEGTCNEQVVLLKKLICRASKHEEKFKKTQQVFALLKEEEATWKLVKNLFKDRLQTSLKEEVMMDDEAENQPRIQGVYQSDKKVVDALFDRDQVVREAQVVIDWLESCAQEESDYFSNNVKFFSDRAVGHENANHRLQNSQPGMPVGQERALITELDPDAPVRQGKLLDDLDKEDEDRLLQQVFFCLRAGQLDKAQKLCMDCGQAWRAATLEGWKLFHDPNFDGLGPECQRSPIQGNRYRDVWKKVCWTMSQEPKISLFERAIYATLSGNLRCVLPVCRSWMDSMWAYFRVYVDRRVEEEIRLKTTLDRSLEQLPGEYWEKHFDVRSIFKEIEASQSVEPHNWYHVIQKHVILGDISGLIEQLYDRVQEERSYLPLHVLRFMAHFVLFLRTAEQNTKDDLCNSIIESYVEELIKEKQNGLIAFYVSKLPPDSQVHWYAQFLEGITDTDNRQQYLDLAEEAGLDLALITKRVVENIRAKSDVDFSSLHEMQQDNVDTAISEDERRKIEAIDWLVYDISQRAEALKQANAVMRMFIAMKKLNAAREVFDKLPPDSVDVVLRTWYQQTGTSQLLPEDRNAVREYLCIKAYLDAMESFNEWFSHYHHSKPRPPTAPQGGSFTDRVAHEHQVKQFETEHDRWLHNLLMQTKTTKDHIYNVLLFPEGGWMIDQLSEVDEMAMDDTEMGGAESNAEGMRQEQLDSLRRLVLPGLLFLLHNVLHTSELYQECVRLADIVTAEENRLYQVFRKEELQRLMSLLRESSLKLLDSGRGPVGFELS